MNPVTIIILLGIGFAFGAYAWPKRVSFEAQLAYCFAGLLITAIFLGAMHREVIGFVSVALLTLPFFVWAAENKTGWRTIVIKKPRLVYVRPENKDPRKFQNRDRRQRQGAYPSWAFQKAISERTHSQAA